MPEIRHPSVSDVWLNAWEYILKQHAILIVIFVAKIYLSLFVLKSRHDVFVLLGSIVNIFSVCALMSGIARIRFRLPAQLFSLPLSFEGFDETNS